MKSIYCVSGAVFCLACGLLFSEVPGTWLQVLLLRMFLIGGGTVLLAVGLRTAVKKALEKEAAQNASNGQRISALLEAVQTLHGLREPLEDLKLALEQQKHSEVAYHGTLIQQIEESNSLVKKVAELMTELKELDKRCLEAIFGELCDLRSDTAQGAEQRLEVLSHLGSHAEELSGTLQSFQNQQKRADRKLTETLTDINEAVDKQIQELKTSLQAQSEANRSSMVQIMETYSELTDQDFALLKAILEETNGS